MPEDIEKEKGEMAELQANPSLLEHAEPEEISRLKAATKRFQQVLEEHRRLVQTTKSVTDRMLKAITDEVSAKQRPVEGYDQTATMTAWPMALKPCAATTTAVS